MRSFPFSTPHHCFTEGVRVGTLNHGRVTLAPLAKNCDVMCDSLTLCFPSTLSPTSPEHFAPLNPVFMHAWCVWGRFAWTLCANVVRFSLGAVNELVTP